MTEQATAQQDNATATAAIETLGLTKVFKDFWLRPKVWAVRDLDLTVSTNECYGLLGPNGAGKSTAIKMMLGLLYPTSGQLHVLGRLPTDVRVKERIGYLPEETYLYPFLNAEETLDYYGRLFQLPRGERRRRIETLLDMVGLQAVRHRPVGEYSKGMQRRIGLAQALINNPQVLILDEPTSGMDPIGTRQIKDLISTLKQQGKTIVLSSHLLADVEDVCDRVGILYGGRLQAQGDIEQLLERDRGTVIEADGLTPEMIGKIQSLVQESEGATINRVERPRRKLEEYFLEIVESAQASGEATSGAVQGGAVPAFLGGPGTDAAEGQALIDQLMDGGAEKPEPAAAEPTADPQEEQPDESVLEQLSNRKDDAPPQEDAQASDDKAAKPGADERRGEEKDDDKRDDDVDRGVIDDLLGSGGR
jgi:ABC-2 type transport system ATP-binding protein